jgi:hypothetical protein
MRRLFRKHELFMQTLLRFRDTSVSVMRTNDGAHPSPSYDRIEIDRTVVATILPFLK